MRAYYYLYFRLYKFAKSVGTVDATWTAMLLISMLIFLNLATVLLLIFKKSMFFIDPRILGSVSISLVGFVNYLIFIRKDFCFGIIKNFENENLKEKRLSIILTIIYITLTIYSSHFLV